jgi:6-phosphogluconolactonase
MGMRLFLLSAFLLQGLTLAMASSHTLFLGTYTSRGSNARSGGSRGIYSVRLDRDTGALSEPVLVAEAIDPGWLTFTPDKKFLYVIHGSQAQAIGFSVDGANAKLTPLPATASPAASPPSYLAVDATGRALLAANYRDGYIAAMPIHKDGTLGAPNITRHEGKGPHPRQDQPHPHSFTLSPDNRHAIVCDLGVDKIFSYALDPANAKLTPAASPFVATEAGAGPRHFKFGADGKHAYAINELANTIAAYDYDSTRGAFVPRQTISTLPADFKGASTTAEVRVHPNGKFVYGSNRGHDSIAVFAIDAATGKLTSIEIVLSGGKNPRNFALSPDGRWLVCGHQDTPLITVFRVDPATGRLVRTEHTANVPTCVCVLFYD